MDIESIRADFPALNRETRPGVPLVYLDSTASSQKPVQVIQVMEDMYRYHFANIHRGIHLLAEEATAAYEAARGKVANFINASSVQEVIFTRNTTESINLVAYTWGRKNLLRGDTVLLTEMEHHSNLVPWQILSNDIGLNLEFIPVLEDGLLEFDSYYKLLEKKPKLVAFTEMSNVLGTINSAKEIVSLAHQAGAVTLIDAAQSVPHIPVDVMDLEADFYVFSGHKMLGPSGVGVLYGRKSLLEDMPPFLGGGDMIKRVELRSFQANALPYKFEAGTPAIVEAVGLGAAVDYLSKIGMDAVASHEKEIGQYAQDQLRQVPGLWIFGPEMKDKGAVFSFTLPGIHPHDVSQVLDNYGIAVRAGHHCAMPLHKKFSLPATTRASFYLYNTKEEVDKLIVGLYKVIDLFS